MDIKVLFQDEKQIIAELENGTSVIFHKIDIDKLKQQREEDLKKAAKHISEDNFNQSLYFTNSILLNIPTIDHYEEVANGQVELLQRIYNQLKPHNLGYLVKSMIKDISPEIYGKAQTFMNQVVMFNNMLKEIDEYRKGN